MTRDDILTMLAVALIRTQLNPRELTQDEIVKEQYILDLAGLNDDIGVGRLIRDVEELYTKLINKVEEDTYGEFTGIIN